MPRKGISVRALVPIILCLGLSRLAAQTLVEAETFKDKGGWVLDNQFMSLMGSPFLLAHGMGEPVRDAVTTVALPAAGTYKVWARTRDWAPYAATGAGDAVLGAAKTGGGDTTSVALPASRMRTRFSPRCTSSSATRESWARRINC